MLSDLHLEFAPFVPDPVASAAADVVVLAGDIHQGSAGIAWARQTFPDKPVVYVAGNHEFYGQHWERLLAELHHQAQVHEVHFLENNSVTIAGIRFLGATLWTDFEFFGDSRRSQMMRAAEATLNDFREISAQPLRAEATAVASHSPVSRLTAEHTLLRHQESMAWLKNELLQGSPDKTVVVTGALSKSSNRPKLKAAYPRILPTWRICSIVMKMFPSAVFCQELRIEEALADETQ